jgi:hypothetical protein
VLRYSGGSTPAALSFWASALQQLRDDAAARVGGVMLFDLLQAFQERSVAAYAWYPPPPAPRLTPSAD